MSGMAVRSGLKLKIYRTPMLTTRAQRGGRTSTRSHVAKEFVRQLERMADTASLFRLSYHQAPLWMCLYVWMCRSLSSTSSLFSGILFSSVQQNRRCVCVGEDAEVCQPNILIRTNICVSNPAGMPPSVIRRTNPDHTQS